MRVDAEVPFRQLMRSGRLATLRNYPYKRGQRIYVKHKGKVVGLAVVEFVADYERWLLTAPTDKLPEVLAISGFSSFKEWEDEARRLNKDDRVPKYLVIIRLLKKYDSIRGSS